MDQPRRDGGNAEITQYVYEQVWQFSLEIQNVNQHTVNILHIPHLHQ